MEEWAEVVVSEIKFMISVNEAEDGGLFPEDDSAGSDMINRCVVEYLGCESWLTFFLRKKFKNSNHRLQLSFAGNERCFGVEEPFGSEI